MPEITKVIPHLVVKGAAEAIDFYVKAFDAVEKMRMPMPSGLLMHASLTFPGGEIMLCDEFPENPTKSPLSLGGSPLTIHLTSTDVDATYAQAIEAGATSIMPPADMFWGDRYSQVVDPFGHRWSISTPIEKLTVDQMKARGEAFQAEMQPA